MLIDHVRTIDQLALVSDPVRDYGGKAASLLRLRSLGLRVPKALVLPCRTDVGLDEIRQLIESNILRDTFPGFGDGTLLSVRSGAPVSMPGMMDTVLNVGRTGSHISLAEWKKANPLHVHELDHLQEQVKAFTGTHYDEAKFVAMLSDTLKGKQRDPEEQLFDAITEVYASYYSDRAICYREDAGISHSIGTGCIIQEMVFGDKDENSCTGVLFSRSPRTGDDHKVMNWLPQAQGEAVVSGESDPLGWEDFRDAYPDVAAQMNDDVVKLEGLYRDMVDIEFTIESGQLYYLQTRRGKRTAMAEVRITQDLIFAPHVKLSRGEANSRIDNLDLKLASDADLPEQKPNVTGFGVVDGMIRGVICRSKANIEEARKWTPNEKVIFFAQTTSPEDVPAMLMADAVLTAQGGTVSHAALICREKNIPSVVGCGMDFNTGAKVLIDGSTGNVWVL